MCEGASKQTPGLKIQPRRDRAPRFEIPGSATVYHICFEKFFGLDKLYKSIESIFVFPNNFMFEEQDTWFVSQ